MPAKTAITFRTPVKVKREAARAARKVGVSLSTVLTSALKDFVANPKLLLTENGFTPEFEEEILRSSKMPARSMTKQELLKSLKD